MSSTINLNGVKDRIGVIYHQAKIIASEWKGRIVSILKSGTEKALPYLQDKRIAVVSLIVLNLFLCEIANLSNCFLKKCLPNQTSFQKSMVDAIDTLTGVVIIFSGVAAFTKYAKLPLAPLTVLAISVMTVFVRALSV